MGFWELIINILIIIIPWTGIEFKVTPYSYLARGDWVLKWLERAQFSNWYVNFHYAGAR